MNRIPVGSGKENDKLIWNYTSKGDYTVKNGYFLAQQIEESSSNGLTSGLSSGLEILWNLRLPNKIKIQFWRSLVNALPIKNNMLSRGFIVDLYCPICHSFSDITQYNLDMYSFQ